MFAGTAAIASNIFTLSFVEFIVYVNFTLSPILYVALLLQALGAAIGLFSSSKNLPRLSRGQ